MRFMKNFCIPFLKQELHHWQIFLNFWGAEDGSRALCMLENCSTTDLQPSILLWDGLSCPGWPQTFDVPAAASLLAVITGICHRTCLITGRFLMRQTVYQSSLPLCDLKLHELFPVLLTQTIFQILLLWDYENLTFIIVFVWIAF